MLTRWASFKWSTQPSPQYRIDTLVVCDSAFAGSKFSSNCYSMDQSIDDFVILDDLQHAAYSVPTLWLTPDEISHFSEWKQQLKVIIPFWTAVFSALHVLSVIAGYVTRNAESPLKPKDQYQWHNKVVAGTHAAAAFILGMYWVFGSGEMSQIGDRTFIFLPVNSHIAALGIGYFLYDFMAMLALAPYTNLAFLVGVLVHHLIFILAYASTLVLPVSLSVTAFHFFQLTELSTVFLHISWMASKRQVQYFYLFAVLIALLATFFIRLVTNAYIVFHVVTRLLELRLWEVNIPQASQPALIAYCLFFVGGSTGMLIINFTWFSQLIKKAQSMIRRVNNGQPPSRDYETTSKHD
eukprot:jgi/Ulvmu1/8382/UM042_0089.1